LVLSPTEFGTAAVARVNDHAPKLEKKLAEARAAWVESFWSRSGLEQARKATAEPFYEDENQLPITPDEAAELKKIIQDLEPDGYAAALYDEMAIMVSAGWISGAELLNIVAEFDTVPQFALDAIRQNAEQFAFVVNQREQQAVFDVIDTALVEGQTPKELAGIVADTFADGYHIATPEGVVRRVPTDSWSKMVARTELSRAQTLGAMSLYQAAGIETVMWVTNSGQTVCDECSDADGEVRKLGDPFDGVDTDTPPAHPNCCCSLVPADEDVAYQPEAA